uniref:F-box domain-containing protein n=2 Tax=gambiae species complex TaxID=44542 RepID=A0A453YZ68_ANOGA
MDSSASQCFFEWLPPEIMCIIFDHLDHRSRKSASLACRRWEQIYSNYCTKRSALCNYKIMRTGLFKIGQNICKDATSMLKHTQRPYRKVDLDLCFHDHYFGRVDDRVTEVLIELFKPRWLQQLVVLKLGMRVYPEKFTVELSDAVAKMDHLQELDLSLMRCTKDWPLFSQLKVKNATLDKLKVHGVWPGVIDCPNLRALELDFPLHNEYKQYLLHQKEEPCWSMKQLQELCIRGGLTFREQEVVDLSTGMEQFCKPMPQIKRLYFDYFIVSERLLRIICESFVHLESLMLHILKMDDSNALRHLEKLPNLREFGIWDIAGSHAMSFASVCLPKLEKLLLGWLKYDYERMPKLHPMGKTSFRWRLIRSSPVIDDIDKSLKHLRFLWVDLHLINDHLLTKFSQISTLETLVLENVDQKESVLAVPFLKQLKRLVLYCCEDFDPSTIKGDFAKRVPNVKSIKVIFKTPSYGKLCMDYSNEAVQKVNYFPSPMIE